MTAHRVITDHNELDNIGHIKHDKIDEYFDQAKWVVVSGSLGDPPQSRRLVAGPGIELVDNGPGNNLIIQSSDEEVSENHKKLTHLIHFIDGPGDGLSISPYRERSGYPFVTRLTWWDSPTKTRRIFQTELTRSQGGFLVTNIAYKLYDLNGNLASTALDEITYLSGAFESTRTRTFT